jgi:glycerol-3-phosphate dehydrogenase (NAD(P)+)
MAMSWHLSRAGKEVTLWEFDAEACERLQNERGDAHKLRGFRLPDNVDVTNDAKRALKHTELVVLAVPAQFVRSALTSTNKFFPDGVGVVNLAKGIENKTLMRMSQVIEQVVGDVTSHVATLSGPSHAEEVILDMPTTVTVAATSAGFANQVQEEFSGDNFRVYKSDDLIGVELGGSVKNIIAIAAGIIDGLGMGDNTRGALMTRGLAEIARLGAAMGAQVDTFAGLSGLGDLVTTCISRHSRNRHVGEQIGRGVKLDAVLAEMTMVAEGVATTQSVYELARRQKVEMPITNEIYQVLFHDKSPEEAVAQLMGRRLKHEIWQ